MYEQRFIAASSILIGNFGHTWQEGELKVNCNMVICSAKQI